jgi:hypothetical protein
VSTFSGLGKFPWVSWRAPVRYWKLIVWIVPLLARQWPRVAAATSGGMSAGDHDRERAAALLRERYAGGYLSLDELTKRVGRVVTARSRRDLRRALSGVPAGALFAAPVSDPRELLAQGRSLARGAALVFFTGAYLVFTFSLLLVVGLAALVDGISTSALLVFVIVWLVPTYLLSRLWRRKPSG